MAYEPKIRQHEQLARLEKVALQEAQKREEWMRVSPELILDLLAMLKGKTP